jgi:hypothetical protein
MEAADPRTDGEPTWLYGIAWDKLYEAQGRGHGDAAA